jgi:hypothetical protein
MCLRGLHLLASTPRSSGKRSCSDVTADGALLGDGAMIIIEGGNEDVTSTFRRIHRLIAKRENQTQQ